MPRTNGVAWAPAAILTFLFSLLLFPVLPLPLILMTQVRSLKDAGDRLRQAPEKLPISVGVLVAPCFLLWALERMEYGQANGGAMGLCRLP